MVRKGRQLFGALVSMLLHKENMVMSNTLDFAPLFRSSIGFDRILDASGQYLHRGIAARAFQRRFFELADHVKVVGASLVNGLLTIDLKRELPEEMKPRRIAIAAGEGPAKAGKKQIETEKQAA
jgi:hypothetical protein